jgi:hypothetical protein
MREPLHLARHWKETLPSRISSKYQGCVFLVSATQSFCMHSLSFNNITAAGAKILASLLWAGLTVILDDDIEKIFLGKRKLQAFIKRLQAKDQGLTALG